MVGFVVVVTDTYIDVLFMVADYTDKIRLDKINGEKCG